MKEKAVRWQYGKTGDLMIASEACGGVVESNMTKGTTHYIASTLGDYILTLNGFVEIITQ